MTGVESFDYIEMFTAGNDKIEYERKLRKKTGKQLPQPVWKPLKQKI